MRFLCTDPLVFYLGCSLTGCYVALEIIDENIDQPHFRQRETDFKKNLDPHRFNVPVGAVHYIDLYEITGELPPGGDFSLAKVEFVVDGTKKALIVPKELLANPVIFDVIPLLASSEYYSLDLGFNRLLTYYYFDAYGITDEVMDNIIRSNWLFCSSNCRIYLDEWAITILQLHLHDEYGSGTNFAGLEIHPDDKIALFAKRINTILNLFFLLN